VAPLSQRLPHRQQIGRQRARPASAHDHGDPCVGQRSLSVTADTYTHVLLDDRDLDHARLIDDLAS
jgi:hypothetical protein